MTQRVNALIKAQSSWVYRIQVDQKYKKLQAYAKTLQKR